jgi:hypothetical protein
VRAQLRPLDRHLQFSTKDQRRRPALGRRTQAGTVHIGRPGRGRTAGPETDHRGPRAPSVRLRGIRWVTQGAGIVTQNPLPEGW